MRKASLWKVVVGHSFMVLVGLVLGLVWFTPWNVVWDMGLRRMDTMVDAMELQYSSIDQANWNRVQLENVDVLLPFGRLAADSLDLRLGLLTPLQMGLVTGPERLEASLSWSKALTLLGGVEVGTLLAKKNSAGRVQLDVMIDWDGFKEPPNTGNLQLSSNQLVWEGMDVQQLLVEAQLAETTLALTNLSVEKPMSVAMQGLVKLNWDNLEASQTEVEGEMVFSGSSQKFTKKGQLGRLLAQAGM